ncbi:hypothetical protein TNCV_899761 [Trichonephila clavipes]|nr:hypothetical protein TNCV_899761 [Trichonephila clavipes]
MRPLTLAKSSIRHGSHGHLPKLTPNNRGYVHGKVNNSHQIWNWDLKLVVRCGWDLKRGNRNLDDPDQNNGTKLLRYCVVISPGQVSKISNFSDFLKWAKIEFKDSVTYK